MEHNKLFFYLKIQINISFHVLKQKSYRDSHAIFQSNTAQDYCSQLHEKHFSAKYCFFWLWISFEIHYCPSVWKETLGSWHIPGLALLYLTEHIKGKALSLQLSAWANQTQKFWASSNFEFQILKFTE